MRWTVAGVTLAAFACSWAASCAAARAEPGSASTGKAWIDRAGGSSVEAVIEAVGDWYTRDTVRDPIRERRIRDIYAADPSLVDKIVLAIDQRNEVDQWRLIAALGALGPGAEAAVPRLLELRFGPDPALRSAAAVALQKMGQPAADAYVRMVEEGTAEQAEIAVRALEGMGPAIVKAHRPRTEALRRRFDQAQEPQDQLLWARALVMFDASYLGSREARPMLPRLREISQSRELGYAVEATALLHHFGVSADEAVPRIVAIYVQAYQEKKLGLAGVAFPMLLNQHGDAAAEPLIKLATSADDPLARMAAVVFLVRKGPEKGDVSPRSPQVVGVLARVLSKDDSDEVRRAAAAALEALGPSARSALPQLREAAASDPSEDVRAAAERAINRIAQIN